MIKITNMNIKESNLVRLVTKRQKLSLSGYISSIVMISSAIALNETISEFEQLSYINELECGLSILSISSILFCEYSLAKGVYLDKKIYEQICFNTKSKVLKK